MKRPVLTLTACIALVFLLSSTAIAQDLQDIILGKRFVFHSEILQQERTVLVYLPPSYNTVEGASRHFPVMYLLDGGAHFNSATGIVHHLSSPNSGVHRIPEMIVIALPNIRRTHSLTPTVVTTGPYSEDSGGAADFSRFLREELFKKVEDDFRTSPERLLVGHSLGGLFALNVFLEHPEMFDHYIAIDPSLWWDNQLLVRRLSEQATRRYANPVTVFIALANSPDSEYSDLNLKKQHVSGIRKFSKLLKQRENTTFRFGFEFFPDETHVQSPLIGTYRGLLFTYPSDSAAEAHTSK